MAKRRPVSNPLALAVLACLHERPMHPYEMAATLRERAKEHSIKLNYGSLYTVVDNLAKHGLIEAIAARREGRRPERTVYRLTSTGRTELHGWMSELLAEPVKEYPQFEAALSLMPVLAPGRVRTLLRDRVRALGKEIADVRLLLDLAAKAGLPRLLLIEGEYHLAMREAEVGWVNRLVADLDQGTLGGLPEWRHWHETGEPPQWDIDFSAFDGSGAGSEGGEQTQA